MSKHRKLWGLYHECKRQSQNALEAATRMELNARQRESMVNESMRLKDESKKWQEWGDELGEMLSRRLVYAASTQGATR